MYGHFTCWVFIMSFWQCIIVWNIGVYKSQGGFCYYQYYYDYGCYIILWSVSDHHQKNVYRNKHTQRVFLVCIYKFLCLHLPIIFFPCQFASLPNHLWLEWKKMNDGFAIEGNGAFPTRKVAYQKWSSLLQVLLHLHHDHRHTKYIYIVKRSKTCKFAKKKNCLAMGCWWRWSGWMDYGLYISIIDLYRYE